MSTGMKILAGCGCLAVAVGIALAAGLGLGLFWLRDQATDMKASLEGLTARVDEIGEWERQANAHPYDRPEEGVIPEPRLVTFLDVRRAVHEVYETHKAGLEELRRKTEGEGQTLTPREVLSLGSRAVQMYGDLRLAQVQALAEKGMSEREYYAIQTAVYVAAGAAKTEAETGRKPAEAMSEAAQQVRDAIRLALQAAQREGVPGADRISESQMERLEEGVTKMGEQGAESLTVPPANVELFRKHEDEIEKYAMHGLTFLGL
jgi:hypothetical protein